MLRGCSAFSPLLTPPADLMLGERHRGNSSGSARQPVGQTVEHPVVGGSWAGSVECPCTTAVAPLVGCFCGVSGVSGVNLRFPWKTRARVR